MEIKEMKTEQLVIGIEDPRQTDQARCPICNSQKSADFVKSLEGGFSWWHCQACDLRFSWPMQAGDSEFYKSVWTYSPDFAARRRKRLQAIQRIWDYRAILGYQPAFGGRLLDIGCGLGEFLFLARELYGYEVAGIDFNERSVKVAKELYGIQQVACGAWPDAAGEIAERSFDRATMLHVVEHLNDPVGAIRSAATSLKPEGLLCVAVPAVWRKPAVFSGELDLPPHHLTLWSESALANAFEFAGLKPVWLAQSPIVADGFIGHWQEKHDVLQNPKISRLLWVIGRRLLSPFVAMSRSMCPTAGSSIVGIARVPGCS